MLRMQSSFEGLDGIENRGKMIGHDWMLRRKGEGRGEDAGLERKNPADYPPLLRGIRWQDSQQK
jgi:hypothetical protein